MIISREPVDNLLDTQVIRPPGDGGQKTDLTGSSEKENSFNQLFSENCSGCGVGNSIDSEKVESAITTPPETLDQPPSVEAAQSGGEAQQNGKLLPQRSAIPQGSKIGTAVFDTPLIEAARGNPVVIGSGESANQQVFIDAPWQPGSEEVVTNLSENAGQATGGEGHSVTDQMSELIGQSRQAMTSLANGSDAEVALRTATANQIQAATVATNHQQPLEAELSTRAVAGRVQLETDELPIEVVSSQVQSGSEETSIKMVEGLQVTAGRAEKDHPDAIQPKIGGAEPVIAKAKAEQLTSGIVAPEQTKQSEVVGAAVKQQQSPTTNQHEPALKNSSGQQSSAALFPATQMMPEEQVAATGSAKSNPDARIQAIEAAGQTVIADLDKSDRKTAIDKGLLAQSPLLPGDDGEPAALANQFKSRSGIAPDLGLNMARSGTSGEVSSGSIPLADGLKVLMQKIELATNTSGSNLAVDQAAPNNNSEQSLANFAKLAMDTPQSQSLSAVRGTPFVATLQVPLGSPDWSEVAARRIVWMVTNGMKTAQLQLNPRDLGPVDIQINLSKDQASINFSSQHVVVREALEASLPRLREMFEGTGVNLEDVNVSDQSFAEQHETDAEEGGAGMAQDDEMVEAGSSSRELLAVTNRVDFYA